MTTYSNKSGLLLLALTLLSAARLSAQCPAAIIEPKNKVFYNNVLNEYTLKPFAAGVKYSVSIDNGELLLKDDKKYIRPAKTGKITITTKEERQNGITVKQYDYFESLPLPDPALYIVSAANDTAALVNSLPASQFKSIRMLTTRITAAGVISSSTLQTFTITVAGPKKMTTFTVKGTDDLRQFVKVTKGEKVIFTNIAVKIEGEASARTLQNRAVEITD